MFIKSKNFEKFLVKFRVEFGSFFDMKEEEVFIVFKELDTFNTLALKDAFDKGEVELLKVLKSILPFAMVEHNLYEDENIQMTNEAVVELIFSKNNLTTKIIGEFINNSFQLSKAE